MRDELECIGVSELADDYQIDLLAGGFPCQDISSAGDRWGNRKGTDGERSGLWWEFARVIEVAEPRWVVIENTGRLRNGRDGAGQSRPADHGPARPSPADFRLLTPLECERALGFPDGWTAGHADGVRRRMCGNAVAVPVAEWIGRRIIAAEADL